MMMASRQALRSPVPPDTNDIDRYINFDQVTIPSPTFSPVSSRSKSLSAPTSIPSNHILPIQPSNQPAFAPPTHQYEAYSNFNGLPAGALFEAYSVNQANQETFGRSQGFYGSSMNTGFDMNTGDDFDFRSGYNAYGNGDMDVDFGTAPQSLLIQPVEGLDADVIDPSAIGGQESPQVQQPPKRAYPGMHQQQAAKAAEQKQKEMEIQKQKQAAASTSRPSGARPSGSTSRPPTDSVVEEKISQLLNQMRHNSVGSSNSDDAATPTANGNSSHGSRIKKDEEDMDEDERLLASEEGKKLSSKERRQLRNKVSARAFRSRRKEYIGQLEGELAAKTTEADELRNKNQALMEENRQLHELTRSLLSSPAFSEFLKDLGGQAATSGTASSYPQTVKAEPTLHSTQKDVSLNDATVQDSQIQQQDTPYVGMTMIPEHPVESNAYESNTDAWANMDFSLYDNQVYAVTSLPEGPTIDQLRPGISDKRSEPILPSPTNEDSKIEPPVIARLPPTDESITSVNEPAAVVEDADFDESDPAFALFLDCPAPTKVCVVRDEEPILGNIEVEKAFGRIELVVEDESTSCCDPSPAAVEHFQRLCSHLDALSERISLITPRF